jgi:hypothetical protein
MKHRYFVFGVAVFALAHGLVLSACAAAANQNPSQSGEPANNAATSVSQTVAVVASGNGIATSVAATLTASAIAVDQSPEAQIQTRVAATLAWIATASAIPSSTLPPPTSAPVPSPTAPPVTVNPAPVVKAPAASKYPAPVLAQPTKWQFIVGPNANITFGWRSAAMLESDERFIVYSRWTYDYSKGLWSNWCVTVWTQDTQWTSTGTWRDINPGCFGEATKGVQKVIQWKVVIQHFVNDQILEARSPESEPSQFTWKPGP